MQHLISIDLDQTKAYPILNSRSGSEFSFLFDVVNIGDKLLFNKHVYNVDEIIETRPPKGGFIANVMFFKVKTTLLGRVEIKAGEKILVPVE